MTAKLPLTVAAAKADGWTCIRVECRGRAGCRSGHHTTEIPWTMIGGGPLRSLGSIVQGLRCQGCGNPPTDVYLHRVTSVSKGGQLTEERLPLTYVSR